MKRYKILFTVLTLFLGSYLAQAQNKYEREHRIKKCQFHSNAHAFLEEKLKDARRIRFYKETDSTKVSFEAKFKKDKLQYSVEFDKEGNLEDIEILINEVDIPEDTWSTISYYFQEEFEKYKVKRIQQQYVAIEQESVDVTLNNAFQNLLLPSVNYEIMVAGKTKSIYEDFEILFSADGTFVNRRKSLPANYDHVLY
ncbi:MAG: hypothetical protein WBN69_01405 [Eudoraea sp.]